MGEIYYYKLFSYNGTEYSLGVTVNDTTLCGIASTPFTIDFEGGAFPPVCWTLVGPTVWKTSADVGMLPNISGYGIGSFSALGDFWTVSALNRQQLVTLERN